MRKQKNLFAAAHTKYFDMLATYHASLQDILTIDSPPRGASCVRSNPLPSTNAMTFSVPQKGPTVSQNVIHSEDMPDMLSPPTSIASALDSRLPAKKVTARKPRLANSDSGATGTYLAVADLGVLQNSQVSSASVETLFTPPTTDTWKCLVMEA